MDFLTITAVFCSQILPIVGVVCLIALTAFLFKLIGTLKQVDMTLNKTHGSIELVEKTLDKVQEPVDTVVKVSQTIDKAHDSSVKAFNDTKEYVVKNAQNIKTKVGDLVDEIKAKRAPEEEVLVEEEERTCPPSPEEILRGE
ncbi:MAG: hypothetical protein Q4B60_05480 [Erysipelotrichaceae bacterium]|nr:hypothetical protein [Erysipelotrichaceae bacterium]